MKLCIFCNELRPLSNYRDNRKKCDTCYNKKRYADKKERRKSDPEYREILNKWDREKMKKKRLDKTSLFYFKEMCRKITRGAFVRKGFKKTTKTAELLGCDWLTFKIHIESKFQEGMAWENHSFMGWHIDHIIPLDTAKTPEEVAILSHYTNLQPLWSKDNWDKGTKIN